MARQKHVPSYRLHKQSGQAIVTLTDGLGNRRDVLLGQQGSPESRMEYARVIAEWETSGRLLPVTSGAPGGLTVNELILAYWKHAEEYYRKNDKPTSQLERLRLALRPVRQLYGHTLVTDFGPKSLKAVRGEMLRTPCGFCKGTGMFPEPKGGRLNRRSGNATPVCGRCQGKGERGWARRHVNSCIGCVKRMFKWGVAEELIPPSVYHGLLAVEGLRKGRTGARETRKIRPVAEEHVKAPLPHLTGPVRGMVLLQQLTGMRPGEVVILRPCDVDRGRSKVWTYRPVAHKTEHHEHDRVIFIGPRAQAVLLPFLSRAPGAYCFSPKESMAEFRAQQRQERRSKVQPSQVCRKKRRPRKQPGDCYSVDTYGNAIERACLRAKVPAWSPNQLRHTKATEIRKEYSLDAARAVLGHPSPAITETYAELDMEKAAEVMGKLG
jgi:integrase